MIRERDIEAYLVKKVKAIGGMCIKWTGQNGVPDRICLLPDGVVKFVELKRPDGKLSALQINMHRNMNALGHEVEVLWSKEDVDEWILKHTSIKSTASTK